MEESVCPICEIRQRDVPAHMASHTKEEMISYFTSKSPTVAHNSPTTSNTSNNSNPVVIQSPKMMVIDNQNQLQAQPMLNPGYLQPIKTPVVPMGSPIPSTSTGHVFQAVPMYIPQQNYVVYNNAMYPMMMPMSTPCYNTPEPTKPESREAVLTVGDVKVILPLDSIKKEGKFDTVASDLAKAILLGVIKMEKNEDDDKLGSSEVHVYENSSKLVETVAEIYDEPKSKSFLSKPDHMIDLCSMENDGESLTLLEVQDDDSMPYQHDEGISLKASETLADSDSEQPPSPSEFVQNYNKSFLFADRPSTSSCKEPDLIDFSALHAADKAHCSWGSPPQTRSYKEEVLDLQTIEQEEPVNTFLPNFLQTFESYASPIKKDAEPESKASTSGITKNIKESDSEEYDLDYESDSEVDDVCKKTLWKCSICSTTFKSFKEKLLHSEFQHCQIKSETTIKTEIKCSCGLTCESADALWNHKVQVFNDDTHCSICHVPMAKRALSSHVKTHTYDCGTCQKKLKTYTSWTKHQLFHLGISPFECKVCGKVFEKKPFLESHTRSHSAHKPFKCATCGKCFATNQIRRMHLLTHMKGQRQECDKCDKDFKSVSSLHRHKVNVHNRKQKVLRKRTCFMCSTCNEVFPTEKKLQWHAKSHQRWPNKCATCGECFVHQSYLTRHIRRKHDAQYTPDGKSAVQCLVCHKFYKASSIWLHMRIHSDKKEFKCDVCGRSFRVKCNLVNHMWVHAAKKARPFKCKICDNSFTRQKFLDAHVRSHKNIRPFTCNECGKSFIYKHNLQMHLVQHTGVKPFACTHCAKRFYRKNNLQNHIRIHTGETPYECAICRKEFTQKSNYNSHMKAFHAERQIINEEI